MFEGAARKFFWSTVASGALAYGSGMAGGPQKILEFIKEVREYRKENLSGSATSSSIQPRLNAANYKGPVPTLDHPLPKLDETVHSEQKYKIEEKEYVVIEGKYYEYRADHVYNVNGKSVFYFNSRARTAVDSSEKIAQAAPAPHEPNFAEDEGSVLDPSAAVKKVRELRKQMDERDQYLNNISNEFKSE